MGLNRKLKYKLISKRLKFFKNHNGKRFNMNLKLKAGVDNKLMIHYCTNSGHLNNVIVPH